MILVGHASELLLVGSTELTMDVVTTMLFQVVGGLGIFLLGMKYMSEGMQAVAGQRLRRMISAVTDNRVAGVGTGTLVTCVVQSSSITTVLVVGFVNSGLMALHQAIGVIMGANIGTTITGWILVLKIGKYGLPIIGVSAFFYLFSKVERRRFFALAIMGLGMVFFGLLLMKNGFKPIREVPDFREAFEWFSAASFGGVLKCVLVGSILTAIVQSSSATLGITIAVASQGVISFETATALVLGQNIGTTITAWLASIGTTTIAKRAAYFHILFNTVGVALVIIIFRGYVTGIAELVEMLKGVDPRTLDVDGSENFVLNMTFAIATAHTVFNIAVTALNLPLARRWAELLTRLVPDVAEKEIGHLTQLDMRLVESPAIGIERSHREIVKMGDGDLKMMTWVTEALAGDEPNDDLVQKIFHREEIMDNVQGEVITFLTDLLSANVPHSVAREGRKQLRVADELESISDYICGLLKAHLRMRESGLKLKADEATEISRLHAEVEEYMAIVLRAFSQRDADVVTKATTINEKLTAHVKHLRDTHLMQISEDRVDPVHAMSYAALLRSYRKIADHALNVAEAVAAD